MEPQENGTGYVRRPLKEEDMQIVAAVDQTCIGMDVGDLCGAGPIGVMVESDLATALEHSPLR